MQQMPTQRPEIKLIGRAVRTNNADEMGGADAKIGPLVQKYFQDGVPSLLAHRKNPGTTFSAFTDYESDFNGDYTYFMGEEVTSFDDVPPGFTTLTIPPQNYTKFTTPAGAMPEVIIAAWQKIWAMSAAEMGGERSYITDFEIYDARAADPQNLVADIYIGVKFL